MDREDELYFNELLKEYNKNISQVSERIKQIWKDTVQEEVYDMYIPTVYADGGGNRTNQLRDMVTSKIENGILYVYADTDNMEYYSFMNKNKPINPEIPVHVVDVGHDTYAPYEGELNMFHHYPARGFIQKFADRVKREFPEYEIQVFRDTPPIY